MSDHAHHQARRAGRSIAVVLVAATAVVLLAGASALARGGPPVGKIYDCYSFSGQLGAGSYNWAQSVELKTQSVYLVAPSRVGNHLVGPAARGRYSVRGRKITWLTGAFAIHHMTAIFKPAGKSYRSHVENEFDNRFDVYERGQNFMTCYEH